MKKVYYVLLIFLSIISCKTADSVLNNPYKDIENYNGDVSLSISEKLIMPNQFVIEFLNKMDKTDVYLGYELNGSEKSIFLQYFNMLPKKYQEIINEKVMAIYFINNFQGAGMTDYVLDKDKNMYITLYFNKDLLYKTIGEWIEYRDSSMFYSDYNINININCATNYLGLLYGLVHESSHVYDFYNHITPFINSWLKNIIEVNYSREFTKEIWKDFNLPIDNYNILSGYEISFYDLGNKIEIIEALELYKKISESPFSSIYGATSWAEDFAETFTWYYLYKNHEILYETEIYYNNEFMIKYCPTDNELVKERYKIFNEIFKQ
jgi:hypothetical protein